MRIFFLFCLHEILSFLFNELLFRFFRIFISSFELLFRKKRIIISFFRNIISLSKLLLNEILILFSEIVIRSKKNEIVFHVYGLHYKLIDYWYQVPTESSEHDGVSVGLVFTNLRLIKDLYKSLDLAIQYLIVGDKEHINWFVFHFVIIVYSGFLVLPIAFCCDNTRDIEVCIILCWSTGARHYIYIKSTRSIRWK